MTFKAPMTPMEIEQMVDIIENDEVIDLPAHLEKAEISVKVDHAEIRVFELELGRSITVILDIVAAERGCGVEELILIREGEDVPLTATIFVEAAYPQKRRHHVHRVSDIAVTVYYQTGHHARAFKRNATVEAVLMWAIAIFNVDPTMASEFELTRLGQSEELPESEHIGHLAGVQCELALNLVRGAMANGGD